MFDESKHPRDEKGQFTKGKSISGTYKKTGETTILYPENKGDIYRGRDNYPQNISHYEIAKSAREEYQRIIQFENLYGEEFRGYKGQQAVNKLLNEKRGHVKNAFFRHDIGMIDLVWGNNDFGLKHIISRREEQKININKFLSDLTECINNGKFRKLNKKGKCVGEEKRFAHFSCFLVQKNEKKR